MATTFLMLLVSLLYVHSVSSAESLNVARDDSSFTVNAVLDGLLSGRKVQGLRHSSLRSNANGRKIQSNKRRRLPPKKPSGGGGSGGSGGGGGGHSYIGCLGLSSTELQYDWIFPSEAPPCEYTQHLVYHNETGYPYWDYYNPCLYGVEAAEAAGYYCGGQQASTGTTSDGDNDAGQNDGGYSSQQEGGQGGENDAEANNDEEANGTSEAVQEGAGDTEDYAAYEGDEGDTNGGVEENLYEEKYEIVTNEDFENVNGEGEENNANDANGDNGNGNNGADNNNANEENGNGGGDNQNQGDGNGNGNNANADGNNNGDNDNNDNGNGDYNNNGNNDNNGANNGQNNNAEAEQANENDKGNEEFDPYEGFYIKECDTYQNLWLWDLSLTCESPEESLESCQCLFAEELFELGRLSCSDFDACPSDCKICETCLRLLGCSSSNGTTNSSAPLSASNAFIYVIGAAAGVVVVVVGYYAITRRRQQSNDDLEAHLMTQADRIHEDDFEGMTGGNTMAQEPTVWLAPDTPPAQFAPSHMAAVESSSEEDSSGSEFPTTTMGTICPIGGQPPNTGDSHSHQDGNDENIVWLAPVT